MPTHSRVWGKAIANGDEWLKELRTELRTDLRTELRWRSAGAALLALRSVLHALRDRLPPDEAVQLAAQLPLLIKGVYFDGWNPSATPVKARSKGEFFALVRSRFQQRMLDSEAELVTRAVFKLLAAHVSDGEIRDVRGMLPTPLAELWPVPEDSPAGRTATPRRRGGVVPPSSAVPSPRGPARPPLNPANRRT